MSIFRILSIICSIVLVVLLVISLNVEANAALSLAIVIVGIATAVFNVIATIAWWITAVSNDYNSNQARWFRMSSH